MRLTERPDGAGVGWLADRFGVIDQIIEEHAGRLRRSLARETTEVLV